MAKRLSPEEEDLFSKIITERQMSSVLLFGRFLALKGLITDEDIYNARMFQKGQNRRLGELAVTRGLLSEDDVNRLLVYQEESGILFGELAVSLGFLSHDQLMSLLEYADEANIYFGEALVSLGILDHFVMKENLGVFQRLTLGNTEYNA